jgi:putative resolvase
LGVSARTLRRYTQEGRLPDARSAGGRRIFGIGDLEATVTNLLTALRLPALGCRRDGSGPRQTSIGRLPGCVGHGGEDLAVFTDVASGLSDRRVGLRQALGECLRPGVDRLLVEHPDRLVRLGVGLVEHLLRGVGVSVGYPGRSPNESVDSDRVADLLAIITSLAGRLWGQRSARARRLRAVVAGAGDGR